MRVIVAGDYCPQARIEALFENGDYQTVFEGIKSIIGEADYAVANLECPVIIGDEKPIEKCGPNLHCSKKGIEALKWVGFGGVTLANNHFFDYGEGGVENTLEICRECNLDTVGGGRNLSEASRILYKKVNDNTLAVINCCEHEFSIASENTGGSNPLNPINQYYAIKEAKAIANYVLVIVHGGRELFQYPSIRMQETYRFFIDCGADAVVNHHQHCYSGFEVYRDKPILYGLGNFCFDDNTSINSIWNEGFLAELDFQEERVCFKLIPYTQCGEEAVIRLLDSTTSNFEQDLSHINSIISDKQKLNEINDNYLNSQQVSVLFEPYSGKFLRVLYNKGLLPSFFTSSKKMMLLAYLQCESHIDKIIHYLKRK